MPLTLRLPALGATPRVDVPPAPYQLRQPPRMFQEEKGKPKPDPRVDVPPVTHQPHQPRRMFREKRKTKTRPTGGCSTRYSIPRMFREEEGNHQWMFHSPLTILIHLSDVPRGRRKPQGKPGGRRTRCSSLRTLNRESRMLRNPHQPRISFKNHEVIPGICQPKDKTNQKTQLRFFIPPP